MNTHQHKVIACSCGNVIQQCTCWDAFKPLEIQEKSCCHCTYRASPEYTGSYIPDTTIRGISEQSIAQKFINLAANTRENPMKARLYKETCSIDGVDSIGNGCNVMAVMLELTDYQVLTLGKHWEVLCGPKFDLNYQLPKRVYGKRLGED